MTSYFVAYLLWNKTKTSFNEVYWVEDRYCLMMFFANCYKRNYPWILRSINSCLVFLSKSMKIYKLLRRKPKVNYCNSSIYLLIWDSLIIWFSKNYSTLESSSSVLQHLAFFFKSAINTQDSNNAIMK